ncbi:hypothetical protein ACWJU0_04935 [Clostridioides difficile]|uniref:hypothetical protein n=1 Tax=Clostridioides difficile TaxID=1496 RepID=UPI00098013C4|nr:hypothetical protein [Clostridioides difficile]AXU32558.1 hypothetical protein CDIF102860_03086 [Clostridioides difficile]AXU36346.1 hypothetical protein CDIF102978_03086 [Clostridioides difficile]MBY1132829.1 hypothetical protein [Clostridioides difficile]MBY1885421.1 hypothetical protein [Clostridioides difficile]MBZ0782255.1 hypothetical protein [Clostridioides difficile]
MVESTKEFDLQTIKVGNAVKVNCKRFGFEIDCIVVVATEEELNLAYFDKERGCMEYQALIPEDLRYDDYILQRLG